MERLQSITIKIEVDTNKNTYNREIIVEEEFNISLLLEQIKEEIRDVLDDF